MMLVQLCCFDEQFCLCECSCNIVQYQQLFSMCVYLQYELVSELFQDGAQAVTSPTRRSSGTLPVRPAKELPKSSSQQKQSRKTVGSQASKVVDVIFGWP